MKQSEINALNILNNVSPDITTDTLEKSHKYFKREGVPGNYKYFYTEQEYRNAKNLDSYNEAKKICDTYQNYKGDKRSFTYKQLDRAVNDVFMHRMNAMGKQLGLPGYMETYYKEGDSRNNFELDLEKSTEEQFCKNGEWDKDRVEKVHKPIIGSYLSKVTKISKTPVVTLMMGAPASGKGLVVRSLKETEEEYKDLLVVNPDDIKQKSLKEDYEKFQKHNLKTAAGMVHEESSYISKTIVEELDKIGAHYLQDKCFSNYDKLIKEINRLSGLGVQVKIISVTSSVEKAYQRMLERGVRTGRYVDEEYFYKQHQQTEETLKKLTDNLPKNIILFRQYHNDEELKLIKQIENEKTQ